MIVYLLLNTINNKGYVGQHKGNSIDGRWPKKLTGGNVHFKRAVEYYGWEMFSKEILSYCSTQEETNNFEKLWILTLRTYDPACGYNRNFGGADGPQTLEARLRISKAHKGSKKLATAKYWASMTPEERSIENKRRVANRKPCVNRVRRYWINNGIEQKIVADLLSIPDGWLRGKLKGKTKRSPHWKIPTGMKDLKWATNGTTSIQYPSDKPLPVGWRYGRVFTETWKSNISAGTKEGIRKKKEAVGTVRRKYITDGKSSKMIPIDALVPEGWRSGRSEHDRRGLPGVVVGGNE